MTRGRTIALYGDTGSGKTTQIGVLAKWHFKRTQGQGTTLLRTCDRGGYRSLEPLVRLGIIRVEEMGPSDDPWTWANDTASGSRLGTGDVFLAIDSATGLGEFILDHITKESRQIGQQKTQRFQVAKDLQVGINNESHYGLVQGFMRDMMWKSTWLTHKGVDVLWTFAMLRGEKQDDTPVLGPMVAGKALTVAIPKWFERTFRLVSIPGADGEPPRHALHLQEQPGFAGTGMSFGNARHPLDATTPLPAVIEPADLTQALELGEQGQEEAFNALKEELGL